MVNEPSVFEPLKIYCNRLEGKNVALDEVAHYEPPHQDLCSLQIQLFSFLVVKELILQYMGETWCHSPEVALVVPFSCCGSP